MKKLSQIRHEALTKVASKGSVLYNTKTLSYFEYGHGEGSRQTEYRWLRRKELITIDGNSVYVTPEGKALL